MNPRHKASAGAIALIKRFEGYRSKAARLPDGRWTLGYGHTRTAREGAQVSEDDAEALLLYDLMPVQAAINEAVFTPLSQNQYDALASFTFNIGVDNFRRSSVLRRVNEGNLIQAACALEMWRKADLDGERIVVDALVRRRSAEKTLFLTPEQGWVPVPSPIVRPRVDYDVGLSLPRSSAEVAVSLNGDRGEAHRAPTADAPATVAAAAAVSARLQAIADAPSQFAESEAGLDLTPPPAPPEEDVGPPPAPAPAAIAVEPTPPAAFVLTAGPEFAPAPSPIPQAAPPAADPFVFPGLFDEPAPLDIPSHMSTDSSRRIVRREAPLDLEDAPLFEEGATLGGLPLLALGLAGLAVFAGSVFWGVNAKGSGGPLDPMVVASVLGLVGIACVASAVYFLLVRLGGRSD